MPHIKPNKKRNEEEEAAQDITMQVVQWRHMGSTRNTRPWSTWSWIQSLTLYIYDAFLEETTAP
jgi:hypothetical protein